jgi:hypothetical protein
MKEEMLQQNCLAPGKRGYRKSGYAWRQERHYANAGSKTDLVASDVGSLLIIFQVKNYLAPAPNLLKASNQGEQMAMHGTMVALVVLGCWLVYTGAKPAWRKNG